MATGPFGAESTAPNRPTTTGPVPNAADDPTLTVVFSMTVPPEYVFGPLRAATPRLRNSPPGPVIAPLNVVPAPGLTSRGRLRVTVAAGSKVTAPAALLMLASVPDPGLTTIGRPNVSAPAPVNWISAPLNDPAAVTPPPAAAPLSRNRLDAPNTPPDP